MIVAGPLDDRVPLSSSKFKEQLERLTVRRRLAISPIERIRTLALVRER